MNDSYQRNDPFSNCPCISSRKTVIKSGIFMTYRFCSQTKDKLSDIVNKSKVVVFMKGVPENPRCGFSNAVVQILRMHGVEYDSYNVLDDEKLRQG
ncbi:glutaredoxin-related protein 5, mitochondrial, partial [Caerostris extrusa]